MEIVYKGVILRRMYIMQENDIIENNNFFSIMTISRAKNIIWGKGECVMIYAMSDIHGQYDLFSKRIEELRPLL